MTGRFCLALLLASSAWLTVAGEGFFLGHFQAEVEEALVRLRGILEEERRPRFPADVPHRYEDKFLLSELSTQAAMLSLVELLSATTAWNRDAGGAMLDFKSCSSCSFLKTEETDVQVGPSQVQETESMLGNWRSTVKTTTKVKHHVWNTSVEWSINLGDPILDGRAGEELRSKTEHPSEVAPPEPPVPSRCKTRQLDVRWLRRRLSDEVLFAVNRSSPACRTPSVNEETQAALDFFGQLQVFADQSNQYLRKQLPQGQRRIYQELQGNLFKPVLSLFAMDNASSQLVLKASAAVLPVMADLPLVVELYRKSLAERLEEQQRTVGDKAQNSLLRAALLFQEMSSLAQQMIQAVQALEGLLHQQLSNALGKTLRSADFSEYIHFHGRVLLGPSYAPQSFVYAVRRPEHHPEGTISIDSMDNAIRTFAVHRPDATPVRVQLSSAATITLHGEHFLHAAIFHRFAREPEQALQLVARARQLSSFVLMVGKIVAADQFEPTAALIIQNKDELIIPLLLETVPTPKEFIDAIHSLSPEQQRFARAFRKMQLSSSLFAVAVVQIKPLLEKVLNLPEYSLTKEIQLTQDLIELFVRYQVPPDLMSYEAGSGDKLGRVSPSQKLQEVKQHVKALWDTISASKEKQLKEQQEEAKMRNMQTCGSEECPMPPPRGVRVMASAMEDSSNYMEMGQVKEAELAATSVQLDSNGPKMAKVRPMYMSRQVPQVHTYASSAPRMMKPEVEVAEDAADAADAESFEANLDTAVSAEKPKEPNQEGHEHETSEASEGHLENGSWDYTKIPHQLDANFLKYDTEAKLRPSKIKVGEVWQKQEQLGFFGDQKKRSLKASEQRRETNQAFDLLDALSRSGALPLESSSLHVLVAATHCFDETIIDTAIKQNQNPIEKLERSMMIVASTIYQKPARLLLQPGEVERMRGLSPALFDAAHKVQKLFPR